jgi:hypothetical protein
MWMTILEALVAFYLVAGALIISAESNLASKFIFKVLPMMLGLPLAFVVAAKLLGWPV